MCTSTIIHSALVQRFARHVSIHTTTLYAQPTEEDLMRAVRELLC